MKKLLKWIGIILGSIIILILIAVIAINLSSNSRINKSYAINVGEITVPNDLESINNGEHIAVIRGCTDCHGSDLSGKIFIDDPAMGELYATNLTGGEGGTSQYTDTDWVKAIRHGIGPDNKPLIFMPSHEYTYISDEDLGDLIAYLKSVENIDNSFPPQKVGLMAKILHVTGQFNLLPVEIIDHDALRPNTVESGETVDYGLYLAVGCVGCHGKDYKGGKIAGVPPDWPPAADLTKSGNLKDWTKDSFIHAMRTGEKPNGEKFSEYMPYAAIGQATDEELGAIWVFLSSLD